MNDDKKKSVLDLIEESCEILKDNKHFHKMTIEGEKTNIVIEKPKKENE